MKQDVPAVEYRIGTGSAFLMVLFAVVCDTIEAIIAAVGVGLILNRFLTIFEYAILWPWLAVKGVKPMGKRQMKKFISTFGLELIPVVGALPIFTLGVFLIIRSSRKEDLENHLKKAGSALASNTIRQSKMSQQQNLPQNNNPKIIREKRAK